MFMVALLLVSNVILFTYYQQANPGLNFSQQLIGYLDTTTFAVVTATTFLPILLALADELFKIGETAEERIYLRKQAQAEQRRLAIEQLLATWNELYTVCNEIVFFDAEVRNRSKIRESWGKLAALTGTVNATFNAVYTKFYNAADVKGAGAASGFGLQDLNVFVRFFNVLVASSKAVASFINDSDGKEKAEAIRDLQSSLGAILEATKRIAQHPMLNVLNLSNELLESSELPGKENELRAEITTNMNFLKNFCDIIRKEENKSNRLFPTIEGKDADAARSAAAKYRQWRLQNPDKPPDVSEEYSTLQTSISRLPHQKKVESVRTAYSLDFVRYLADFLFPILVVESLADDIPLQF